MVVPLRTNIFLRAALVLLLISIILWVYSSCVKTYLFGPHKLGNPASRRFLNLSLKASTSFCSLVRLSSSLALASSFEITFEISTTASIMSSISSGLSSSIDLSVRK